MTASTWFDPWLFPFVLHFCSYFASANTGFTAEYCQLMLHLQPWGRKVIVMEGG